MPGRRETISCPAKFLQRISLAGVEGKAGGNGKTA